MVRIDKYTKGINNLILERGKTLYKNNCVEYMETMLDMIYFNVKSNNTYSVEISVNKDFEIEDINCNCPYFQENKYCKHTVAVIYYYCNAVKIQPQEKINNYTIVDKNGKIIGKTSDIDFRQKFLK